MISQDSLVRTGLEVYKTEDTNKEESKQDTTVETSSENTEDSTTTSSNSNSTVSNTDKDETPIEPVTPSQPTDESEILRKGSKGIEVRQLQEKLI